MINHLTLNNCICAGGYKVGNQNYEALAYYAKKSLMNQLLSIKKFNSQTPL